MTKKLQESLTLFEEYKFPRTRYQGSKYKLKSWIRQNLEALKFESAIDAFSGTSSIAYVLKEMNKTVYTNDILSFNLQIAKALIENHNQQISWEEYQEILIKKENFNYEYFISETFSDIYYLDSENEWLDIVVQNILEVENEHKRAMFFWALYQACISKRPYNLFHRKNLYVRTSDIKRSFGNKTTWDKPFSEHFYKFIKEINSAIFDNKKKNMALVGDALDVKYQADLVYIDTPYIPSKGSLTLYRDFYHFLEGLSDYKNWKNCIDYDSKHRKLHSNYSIWNDKKNIKLGFEQLIEKFKESIIIISYREDGIPSVDEIVKILESHGKEVTVKKIDYQYVLSKKKNLKEILIIGE